MALGAIRGDKGCLERNERKRKFERMKESGKKRRKFL